MSFEERPVSMRIPLSVLAVADTLVVRSISTGRVSRSAVLRLAIERGLAELEQDYAALEIPTHTNLCPACHCLGNPKTYVNGHTTYGCLNPSCEYEDRWDVKDESWEPPTKLENKWKLPFTEFVITDADEKYRMVWEWIGEGHSGDYDSRDEEDEPFLRANLEMWADGEKDDNLSYCTLAPTNTPKSELRRMTHELFAMLDEGKTKRGIMERWTHETRPRQFRRSLVAVEVLSEGNEHLTFDDLSDLHEKITNGDCSGQFGITLTEVVDADRMSALLKEQGSSPEFFDIEEPE